MSRTSPLPADLAQWPSNPYELLGVPRRAAPEEVYSAHDRLAAAFDPAAAPGPCRRLREARDAVLRDLDLMVLLETQPKLELQPDVELAPAPPEPSPADDLVLTEAAPSARSTIDDLWEIALSAGEAEAYRGLMDLLETDATDGLYLRLFWLLTVMPDLDATRSPVDWLVSGLQKCGLSGPLWELYGRALAEDAEEALSHRAASLFAVGAGPDALIDLALYRWRAAARTERWDVLNADLEALRQHVPATESLTWARLLSAALDLLMWSDAKAARSLTSGVFQLLHSLPYNSEEMREVQQRAHRLRELTNSWRALRPEPAVSPPLLALIPLSWSRPFAEVRPQLLTFLAEALRTPRRLLMALDAAQEESLVVAQFARLLEQLQETLPPPPVETRSSRDLAELVFAFLDLADRSSYRNLRPPLLDFCLREAITPEMLAELIAEVPAYALVNSGHLSNVVGADKPLRLVYLAHRLFWT